MIAQRLEGIGEYYFSKKLREIETLGKEGKNIINLGIGSPDLPPHPDVIKTLQEESSKATVHGYQNYKGTPALRNAFATWYQQYYDVTLNAETEILPLIGSKEGIMHICMTYLEPGDIALVPDPGYPAYAAAVRLAGATPVYYSLKEEHGWLPDFSLLEKSVQEKKAKLMFLNYPNMPTGQTIDSIGFKQFIDFARQHNILLVHDNPYSFILNEYPQSILSVDGAMDVAIELNSLSKSHNMPGWRIGVLCGAQRRIDEVLRFKSNMDSGMFQPLQLAAAKALSLGKDWYKGINAIYTARRAKVFQLLDLLQCSYSIAQTGMFVWARIPPGYTDGYALSDTLLYNSNVFLTPGGIFGKEGEPYIRVSLCADITQFEEAITRIISNVIRTKSSELAI